jgi:hypothetical protein
MRCASHIEERCNELKCKNPLAKQLRTDNKAKLTYTPTPHWSMANGQDKTKRPAKLCGLCGLRQHESSKCWVHIRIVASIEESLSSEVKLHTSLAIRWWLDLVSEERLLGQSPEQNFIAR